ncbi:MAG TPA: prepilin-type N-terminal cleavage/methylation domain-containing protein [Candidatus Paceibacterota bacterium]|nr:prepilin-type N-terminal cleavage/methylation domain-containing protein [Candidatus Paceibacterota bacterium]
MNKSNKGFTLIEILIVVAIIAILASVVLVGLGPTQSLGRDARRVADLHEVQNGLELYYNKNGAYPIPSPASWSQVGTVLTGASIGVNGIPDDPSSGQHYIYAWSAAGAAYELAANLENGTGNVWNNYTAPANFTAAGQTSTNRPTCTTPQYCISL